MKRGVPIAITFLVGLSLVIAFFVPHAPFNSLDQHIPEYFNIIAAFAFVPPGFMPDSARPQFVVDIYLPQGTDIDATAKVVADAERQVRAENDTNPGALQ